MKTFGRVVSAPENHLSAAQLRAARLARRSFIQRGTASALLVGAGVARAEDKSLIPPWTRSLGAPVVTHGYGMPSKYEANVQRRQSPGLTPQPQASVSR